MNELNAEYRKDVTSKGHSWRIGVNIEGHNAWDIISKEHKVENINIEWDIMLKWTSCWKYVHSIKKVIRPNGALCGLHVEYA